MDKAKYWTLMPPLHPPAWTPTLEAAQAKVPGALGIALKPIPIPGRDAWGVQVQWQEGIADLQVVEKRIHRAEELGILRTQVEQTARTVLVTPYLTAHLARRCVDLGLQFIDGAGNIRLDLPGLHVCILGNGAPENLDRLAGKNTFKGFNRKGLQVVFGLLADEALLNAPYRHLAKATGVAVGTIGDVIKDLEEAGLLLIQGKKRKLLQRERLLEGWIANYPYKLRPSLHPGRYLGQQPNWWKQATLDPMQAQWSMEVAANRLTGHLQPAQITLYAGIPPGRLATQLRLRPDPAGNVEILERFWDFPNPTDYPADLVPPTLVYADLLASGDPRNADLARMIHEAHLAP
ncbi:MAG TPA: type IV toxin-antitoxin system AbiEi family antitoxin [Holophaga sp.]|nr:type IV toxin-antitoxin system AbiEi family antitoxin [Holophaga sp.]